MTYSNPHANENGSADDNDPTLDLIRLLARRCARQVVARTSDHPPAAVGQDNDLPPAREG
ncbi:hypothetical protein C882_3359 [Caenispirillum salinarum AK4]|uniref:Uncharacterized protein n=1 Tax=Caenispirillum salinarum AK4 TaxID=1238182 RepID=K9GJ24_9PROT|nr:hypothetical protein [Caenispirillum salinarum]EKV25980.1 hypothetical protein C882_3359 [Caenispirillum salinarum AK4]